MCKRLKSDRHQSPSLVSCLVGGVMTALSFVARRGSFCTSPSLSVGGGACSKNRLRDSNRERERERERERKIETAIIKDKERCTKSKHVALLIPGISPSQIVVDKSSLRSSTMWPGRDLFSESSIHVRANFTSRPICRLVLCIETCSSLDMSGSFRHRFLRPIWPPSKVPKVVRQIPHLSSLESLTWSVRQHTGWPVQQIISFDCIKNTRCKGAFSKIRPSYTVLLRKFYLSSLQNVWWSMYQNPTAIPDALQ